MDGSNHVHYEVGEMGSAGQEIVARREYWQTVRMRNRVQLLSLSQKINI